MSRLRPGSHLQAGLSWSRWVFASGDSVTLSGNLKLLQTWRIPGKKRWKGLEIEIIVPSLGKKRFTGSFSLDNLGEERRKRGKEKGGFSSVTQQQKPKPFPLEKSQSWKINWFWVHKCSVGAWCSRKWKNFFSSKISIFSRKKWKLFLEDPLPPALTTRVLKTLVMGYFEQGNWGKLVKVSSHGEIRWKNDPELLWNNVLIEGAGILQVGGVCTW